MVNKKENQNKYKNVTEKRECPEIVTAQEIHEAGLKGICLFCNEILEKCQGCSKLYCPNCDRDCNCWDEDNYDYDIEGDE
jgi:hypothetical protein